VSSSNFTITSPAPPAFHSFSYLHPLVIYTCLSHKGFEVAYSKNTDKDRIKMELENMNSEREINEDARAIYFRLTSD
jgi:hypothetical protein